MDVEKKPRARKPAADTKKTAARKPAGSATKPKPTKQTRATPKAAAPAFGPEHVAERAYYIWESGAEGDQLAHWLRAERELATA